METKNFKIAFATDDGSTISAHFGRAALYEVVEVANGQITGREEREKPSHQHQHAHHVHSHDDQPSHEDRHVKMTDAIQDCLYVVARGMGYGMYNHLQSLGKEAIITTTLNIESAAKGIIEGSIQNHVEKLH